MTYLKQAHFKAIAPEGAKITRLSSKAVQYETDKELGIIYVNTVVYKENKESREITLNTNGRRTNTSKKWINYGLDGLYNLYQRNFERFLERNIPHMINEKVKYYDGITL